MEKIDELVKFHVDFIKKIVKKKGSLTSQVVFCKNSQVTAMVCPTGREGIKLALITASQANPEWIVTMYEGFSINVQKEKEGETRQEFLKRSLTYMSVLKHGDLERAFKLGDKTVKDCIMLVVYMKDKKRMIVFEKLRNRSLKKVDEVTEKKGFGGFLTLEKKTVKDLVKEELGDINGNSKGKIE